jgi:hypothetical protein
VKYLRCKHTDGVNVNIVGSLAFVQNIEACTDQWPFMSSKAMIPNFLSTAFITCSLWSARHRGSAEVFGSDSENGVRRCRFGKWRG